MTLGQLQPTAATLTPIYTVPGATSAVVSSIIVCNTSSSADTFSITLAINGASFTSQQYLFYQLAISGNDTFVASVGISMAVNDQISVYSGSGNVAFTISGVQIT